MLERGDDVMSAEEKMEAKLLYEHEKKQYNTQTDTFNTTEYGRYPSIRPPPQPSLPTSRGWAGPTIGFPTYR